ncbi:hypothetical protein QBC33DRAFT_105837 [Phialemonium atrogriseum]|uniref:Biotrophy-associated secreted protein 2 n=1 Tax=Phialemonium atrogriseum TaxID=1093897 RepID=A0AAJ0BZB0_9PEZI|nr:uncharacterized protein QBC33DRAFT_105837 [Phialemonium atrogriseum]KAK1766607.1 hypothetical protein QBC33DRAFT_105837 [Phialemonium atrogriseum]
MVRISLAATLAFAITVLAVATPNNSGARDVGNGAGKQFTTGGCVADADCQEGCCANNGQGIGICSGIGAEFQNGKQGCGFNDPNAAATIAAAKAQVQKQGF